MNWAFNFYFGWPYAWWWPSVAASGILMLGYAWWQLTARDTPRRRAGILACLRAAAFVLIILYLLEPSLRVFETGERAPLVNVWVDASRSMSFPAAIAGKQTRYEAAFNGAAEIVRVLSESGMQAGLRAFSSSAIEEVPGGSVDLQPGPTDLAVPLASSAGARAVVLLSDGCHNAASDAQKEAERLRSKGTALFTIPVGQGLPNLAIRDVKVRRTGGLVTVLELETQVEVAAGAAGAPLQAPGSSLKLSDEDGKLLQELPILLEPGTRLYAMRVEANQPGLKRFRLEATPLPGEVSTADNSAPFSVFVSKRPLKVLYMEGSEYRRPDRKLWEHQYLEQALEEDPDIDVTVLLRDEIPEARALGVWWVKHPQNGYPKSRRELFGYDVIISSDVDIDYFSDEQLKWTVEFVAERGGGFAMVGGWTAFGPGGYDGSVMDKMLPVDMLGRFEHYVENEEFRWKLAAGALQHPIMRIDPDPERNRVVWETIPPFYGHNRVERAKPAAVPLAYHPADRNIYGPSLILAVQEFGRGRTMALTTDTTAGWGLSFEDEWGEAGDNRYFRRFWRNSVKWLAAYRINTSERHILLATDRAFYRTSETVKVAIEVRDEELRLGGALKDIRLVATYQSGNSVPVALERLPNGNFQAAFSAAEAGELQLSGAVVLNNAEIHQDSISVPVKQEDVESADCVVNTAFLERLAGAGRLFSLERIGELASHIKSLPEMARSYRDLELFHSWLILAAVLALLFSEWALRKRWGLP